MSCPDCEKRDEPDWMVATAQLLRRFGEKKATPLTNLYTVVLPDKALVEMPPLDQIEVHYQTEDNGTSVTYREWLV